MIQQLQLLNKILENKDYSIISQNNLSDKYFYNYKNEFNFIKNHYEMYNTVPDKVTFCAAFPEFTITEVTEPDSYLLEEIYRGYNDAVLRENFNKMKHLLENGEVENAMNAFVGTLGKLQQGSVMTCTDLITDTSRYDRYIERTVDHDKFYLKTGFPELDDVLGGFDRENENVVIMARPGVGKTQLLLYLATVAALHGLRVGIFEGEMTKDKVGYRLDTFLGHIENKAINRGDLFVKERYETYIKSLKTMNIGSIKVMTLDDIPSGECTVEDLRAFAERENLQALFVDQYDLMTDRSYVRNEHEHIANIAKGIKALQVKKKIPIFSVDQMIRAKNEDGTQDTSQAAGSDKVSRYATIMFALEQKLKDDHTMELTINVVKARDGGAGKFTYVTDFNTGRFTYIPSEGTSVNNSNTPQALEAMKNRYVATNNEEDVF